MGISMIHHRCETVLKKKPELHYFKYASGLIFLGFASLLEAAMKKAGRPSAGTHPPAEERLWVAARFAAISNRVDQHRLGLDFVGLVERVLPTFGTTPTAPTLDHPLIQWLQQDLISLQTFRGVANQTYSGLGRTAYVKYLHDSNLSEDDILPMSPTEPSAGNSNQYMNWLHEETSKRLTELDVFARLGGLQDAYPGVWPLNSFNAHVAKRPGRNMVLMNTGLIQINEAIGSLTASDMSDEDKETRLVYWVRRYCEDGVYPSYDDQDHPSLYTKLGNFMMSRITRAIQEFVLVHLYFRLSLAAASRRTINTEYFTWEHQDCAYTEELHDLSIECDLLSLHALSTFIESAAPDDEYAMALQLAGPLCILSFLYLVERYREKHGTVSWQREYPPSADRLMAVENFMRYRSFKEMVWVGGKFISVVEGTADHFSASQGLSPSGRQ